MSIKDKVKAVPLKFAVWVMKEIASTVNREVDLPMLQEKYGATRGRALGIRITDVGVERIFKLESGKAIINNNMKPSAVVCMSLSTMITLIKGEAPFRLPDGRVIPDRFTPLDAYREGRLVVDCPNGETGWLSDLELFGTDIYKQVFPIIKEKIGSVL